eukprot:g17740.t1
MSEAVSAFLNGLLGIPVFVYIDDITFLGAESTIQLYADAMREFLGILGVAVAPEKTEIARYGEELEVLGIMFRPHADRCEIWVPEKKTAMIEEKTSEIMELIQTAPKAAANSARILDRLKRLSGYFIHTLFSRKRKRMTPLTKFIYWLTSNEKQFIPMIASEKNRRSLTFLLQRMSAFLRRREKYAIRTEDARRGRRHLFTDASADGTDVALGAVLYDHQQNSDYHLITHMDNSPAVHSVVKGQLRQPLTTAVIIALHEFQLEKLPSTYHFYAYVNTHANPADRRADAIAKDYGLLTVAQCLKMKANRPHATRPNNFYNTSRKRVEQCEEVPVKRMKATRLVPLHLSKKWSMSDQAVLRVWPSEEWYPRTEGLEDRNSKWKVYMQFCRCRNPSAFFEVEQYQHPAQVEWLKQHHPIVTWATLQSFGMFLIDHGYQTPLGYISVASQRLRELNVLDRENPHSSQIQTQTFERLKAVLADMDPTKAVPPTVAKVELLTKREQQAFSFWMSSGLRPQSMAHVRPDLIFGQQPVSDWVKVLVPVVKVNAKPGEFFAIFVPADCYDARMLPIEKSELASLCRRAGTTTYGPRRALAIFLRLAQVHQQILPRKECPRFRKFKERVQAHMGWSPSSDMWEEEYSKDALLYLRHTFAVHRKLKEWLTIPAARPDLGSWANYAN